MHRPPLPILLLLLLECIRLAAQPMDENGFTRYTRMDGLSNNSIKGIAQDSLGYIWIATNKGLNRFDGRFFNCYDTRSADYPLPDNTIGPIQLEGKESLVQVITMALIGIFRNRVIKPEAARHAAVAMSNQKRVLSARESTAAVMVTRIVVTPRIGNAGCRVRTPCCCRAT